VIRHLARAIFRKPRLFRSPVDYSAATSSREVQGVDLFDHFVVSEHRMLVRAKWRQCPIARILAEYGGNLHHVGIPSKCFADCAQEKASGTNVI
jgi:hypothetical protein